MEVQKMTHQKIKSILGIDFRARHNYDEYSNNSIDPFINPIIHKKINGKEIIPLNMKKLWGK